ncbi:MAG: ribosome small subunit-dependent GTPase A [Oscillospiraceae bacterium]|nr:ribosome small subunit-dependent GTPase A [Oscillospiraceae bacterium]
MGCGMTGIIIRALSGFYDVDCGGEVIRCRARGKFRYTKESPLVGDRVEITPTEPGTGRLDQILERINAFERPAVANMEQMVIIVSEAIPITDPFLIDRVAALAEMNHCEPIVVVNKCDLADGESLYDIYRKVGYRTIRTSALTGEGVQELKEALENKVSVLTGNSGVGKSSLLNAMDPTVQIPTGEVSEKLGRGRHTTRHVELFRLGGNAIIADTPGFSSFDTDTPELLDKETLATAFREFRPFLDDCRYVGCAHVKEKGCAVLKAKKSGVILKSRHDSYVRLYQAAKEYKAWENNKK